MQRGRGEPIANCGVPLESQASKHEAGLNPNALFVLVCAETEVCLFNYPTMELVMKLVHKDTHILLGFDPRTQELPFKVWKAQLVKRDVEFVLAVAEISGKLHTISEPHLAVLARELTLSPDLKCVFILQSCLFLFASYWADPASPSPQVPGHVHI